MTFNFGAGATTPMTLNHRRIELGVGPQVLQTISNSSTQALTINTYLLDNSTAVARTLTLSGSGTGLSTFAGNMVEGASTLRVTKARDPHAPAQQPRHHHRHGHRDRCRCPEAPCAGEGDRSDVKGKPWVESRGLDVLCPPAFIRSGCRKLDSGYSK